MMKQINPKDSTESTADDVPSADVHLAATERRARVQSQMVFEAQARLRHAVDDDAWAMYLEVERLLEEQHETTLERSRIEQAEGEGGDAAVDASRAFGSETTHTRRRTLPPTDEEAEPGRSRAS